MASSEEGHSLGTGNEGNSRQHTNPTAMNMPTGQRYMIRMNTPGQAEVRYVYLNQPHGVQPHQVPIRIINAGANGQPGSATINLDPIVQQMQQQQKEKIEREEELRKLQEKKERARKDDIEREERLKKKLEFDQPPWIEGGVSDGDEGVEVRWEKKEVEVPQVTAGEVMYSVLVFVDDKPESKEIYNDSANFCAVPVEVLTLGHTHHFTVTACLGMVRGGPSTRCSLNVPAKPPSKPLPPKVSNRTKNSLMLRWNATSDNGSPITHYELEWDQCKGEWEKLASDKAKQFKFIHKFPPASCAQFRVRAFNTVGSSTCSDVLIFNSGAGPPSVPQPPSMFEIGIRHIGLQWVPPQANGADITSYTLEMEDPESGYGYRPVYQGEYTNFTCAGLQRITSYNFRLTASNEKGHSPASPSVMYKTLPSIPGPPAAPFLKGRTTSSALTIVWKKPADNGGAEVQSYILQMNAVMSPLSMASKLVDVYTGPDMTHRAEGLLPGRRYETRVCAISCAGQGQWSPIAVFSTPAVPPSPPLSLLVLGSPTQGTITVQWGYPLSDGGSVVISHSVEMRHVSSTDWSTVATLADTRTFEGNTATSPSSLSSIPHTLTHTITQLLPGEQYLFRVKCQNAVGISNASVECTGLTSPGQPDCPECLETQNITATSAQLHWKIPGFHGCPVEGYKLQWFAEHQSDQVLTSSSIINHTTIQKLSPATIYQARVKALSSAGPSEWSAPVSFTTSFAPPSPPSYIRMVSSTPSSLLIAWCIPKDNGSPVTAYYVEVGIEASHMICHVIKIETTETQHSIPDLKPSTVYKYRVQAENAVGKGLFGSYGTGTTLPPPPPPPHLSLASCSSNVLKIVWSKKTSRLLTVVLHMASVGNQFHEVFRGSSVSHRITRLLPDTDYVFRIAAISDSGQGEWSDSATFSTTPISPEPPTGVTLKQASNTTLLLEWEGGEFSHPLSFEAQYRATNSNQEFQQCYKGTQTSSDVFLSPPIAGSSVAIATTMVYEARVRSTAVCTVNGRKEQLWSAYSNSALCRWADEVVEEVKSTKTGEEDGKDGADVHHGLSGWTIGVLVFVLVTFLTVIASFFLGNVVV